MFQAALLVLTCASIVPLPDDKENAGDPSKCRVIFSEYCQRQAGEEYRLRDHSTFNPGDDFVLVTRLRNLPPPRPDKDGRLLSSIIVSVRIIDERNNLIYEYAFPLHPLGQRATLSAHMHFLHIRIDPEWLGRHSVSLRFVDSRSSHVIEEKRLPLVVVVK